MSSIFSALFSSILFYTNRADWHWHRQTMGVKLIQHSQINHLILKPGHFNWWFRFFLLLCIQLAIFAQNLPFKLLLPAYSSCFICKLLYNPPPPQLLRVMLYLTSSVSFLLSWMPALFSTPGTVIEPHFPALAIPCWYMKGQRGVLSALLDFLYSYVERQGSLRIKPLSQI